ncbi:MAG: histidine phosphatase family protein [Rubrobacter sp.]|jgi:broad specificity phosphatase PhoE|nr:histidine phosphatase family protein [Rubrobacter sp.]
MIETPRISSGEILLSTVRHGLTELNRGKRIGGRVDVPLIEEGREQAREAKGNFEGTPFDVIISSPLVRAIETAEIVTGVRRDAIEIDEDCVERSFGEMEGMLPGDVREKLPHVEYTRIGDVGYSLNPPGGETFEDLHARAEKFLSRAMGKYAGKRVVLFAHENFLQQLHGAMRGLDPMESLEIGILNCEMNEFHLGSEGGIIAHRKIELCPSASEYPSF